jgi:hypothetical protein
MDVNRTQILRLRSVQVTLIEQMVADKFNHGYTQMNADKKLRFLVTQSLGIGKLNETSPLGAIDIITRGFNPSG